MGDSGIDRPTTGSRLAGWIGYACILVGIGAVAVTLASAAGGLEGGAIVGIVVGVVVFVVGVVMTALNFRRRSGAAGETHTHEQWSGR